MTIPSSFDCVVVGGGPAGATAAEELARKGYSVLMLDKGGRIKPCGGAVPPRLIADFAIPDALIVARVKAARMVAPSQARVDMPIEGGYVGMVDRDVFDEWLRERAQAAGVVRQCGTFRTLERDPDGCAVITFEGKPDVPGAKPQGRQRVRARCVIGADGALSEVAKQALPNERPPPFVFAYHEIIQSPVKGGAADFNGERCDVYYQGPVSPDFYGWIFPHGDKTSVGTGSAHKGFSLRGSVKELRAASGLADCATLRCEGAPIPLKPRRKWDNGRDVVLAGDAAGVVAPASGEGIYYAMASARMSANAADRFLATGNPRALAQARSSFMRAHGRVFWVLGLLQYFWYHSDKRRERFVSMCRDPDVQRLTFEAYMNKELVRRRPLAHAKIFFKDVAHLLRLVPPT